MAQTPHAATSLTARPVAAQYVATFLKPEMLHLYRQIRALTAYRPVVICQKREGAGAFPFEDVIVLPKPRTHQIRRWWQKSILGRPITIYRSEARRLEAHLHALGARLLHIYFGHIGVHLLPWLEQTSLPAIVSFHGADAQVDHRNPAYLPRLRRVFTLVRLVVVRSESIAARLIEAGCPPEKIRLHRTGLPLEETPFSPHRPPADGRWKCVQACRLIAKKGLPTTLRAFAKFAERWPLATLTIAGDGPMAGEIRSLAESLGVADRMTLTGFLGQADLRALYTASHLFLHPSEVGPDGDQEGVPNSMLEAMANGLPVLATRHGGIPEAVEEGRSGLLVAEKDAEGLAVHMLALADDPARYEAMSRAASERVRAEFDSARQARVLESIYAEIA